MVGLSVVQPVRRPCLEYNKQTSKEYLEQLAMVVETKAWDSEEYVEVVAGC